MGLDQWINVVTNDDDEIEYTYRKFNFLRLWLVNNNDYDDTANLDVVDLPYENLLKLRKDCKTVLDDHDKADSILPTQDGFFFGSTDYDDWYFNDVKKLYTDLNEIVNNYGENIAYITYEEWW